MGVSGVQDSMVGMRRGQDLVGFRGLWSVRGQFMDWFVVWMLSNVFFRAKFGPFLQFY